MEEINGNDRYLDPPDPPTRGTCERCGDILDYGDMCADIVKMEE